MNRIKSSSPVTINSTNIMELNFLKCFFVTTIFVQFVQEFDCFLPMVLEDESGLEFCEGQKYVEVGRDECPGGLTFGNQTPPSCICLRGIFRAHMENCEVSDGFAKDVCMFPYEKLPGHTEKNPKINRVRSLQFLAEPDWDETHVVMEGPSNSWSIATHSSVNKPADRPLKAASFYMVNGKAYISKKEQSDQEQVICVEPSDDLLAGTQVCKVCKETNRIAWADGDVVLKVRKPKGCWLEHGDMLKLTHEPCLRPLLPRNDECRAACVREGRVKPPTWPNCPSIVKTITWDNEYLERQLKQYIVQSQIKGKPKMEAGEPIRTMELMQLLVQITAQFCDDKFVKPDWLNWMADLFYLLHKGNRYKYPEYFVEEDYKFTKKILEDCLAKGYHVRLTNFVDGMLKDKRCQRNDLGPAVAYCKQNDEQCLKPIPIEPINEKMEHKIREKQYVPEVAWNILDATQAICFREFNASYRMFHILQQAIENLFTIEIKNLWYHPPSNHKERLKTMISGKGAEERIGNLEICIGAAYHMLNSEAAGKFGPRVTTLKRLTRPQLRNYYRKKRSIGDSTQEYTGSMSSKKSPGKNFGKMTEVFCSVPKSGSCATKDTLVNPQG